MIKKLHNDDITISILSLKVKIEILDVISRQQFWKMCNVAYLTDRLDISACFRLPFLKNERVVASLSKNTGNTHKRDARTRTSAVVINNGS